jgi:HAD superfamily hydrolase (TIGR01458 family)
MTARPAAVILDMEGVLHVDWQLLPGAAEAVRDLRASGIELAVLTNTTGRTRADISQRLAGMGVEMPAERVITAASATVAWVRRECPGASVYLLGEQGSVAEFAAVELVSSPDAAGVIVVAGPTADTAYPQLDAAFKALMRGTPLVAMQRNRWWPTLAGPAMDAGGIVAALEYAADVEAVVVAKPSPGIFEVALEVCGTDAAHAEMVGDDLHSDLAPARALGMRTCLVRTGKGSGFSPAPGEVSHDVADLAAYAALLLS